MNHGWWKEAEELEAQVTETNLRVLGAEHPDTLTTVNNLAFTWEEQDWNAEAFELMKKLMWLWTRIYGIDYSDTLFSSAALID